LHLQRFLAYNLVNKVAGEADMSAVKRAAAIPDLTIFDKFKFKLKPVAVKFLLFRPEGIGKLKRNLSICEMIREAQKEDPFYAAIDNFTCVEPILLGMAEGDPVFESGHIGQELGIFEEARANRRLYHYITKLEKNSVNYVAFASTDKLKFTPDILMLSANPEQLEIILRALCFATGKMWTSQGPPVMECSWILTYPYISGEVNYLITDISHGMKSKQIYPPGTILISIPFDRISQLVDGLERIDWHPAVMNKGKEYHEKVFAETNKKLHKKLEGEKG
jgi:uncharacterized protein (DUF169 family)